MFKNNDKRPTGNFLLDGLLTPDLAQFSLKEIALPLGEVIYESGQHIGHAYFPTTCVISCLYTTQTGATAETALVGNDGVLGTALFLADGTSSHRAVVQVGGNALRIPAKVLQTEFARGGAFQATLLGYTHALITQISQTAVCNRLHPLEQRLCRWLLLCHDRVAGSEFLMTQEFIGNMLGGRRESVTVAAGHLQDLGLIRYSRGHISIVDRRGLEDLVCECYAVVRAVSSHKDPHQACPTSAHSHSMQDGGSVLSAD